MVLIAYRHGLRPTEAVALRWDATASFFNGWRSTPGTIPATSQLDRLISMTAINVPSGSRAVRDRLRSFNFCMGRSIGSHQRRWRQYPRRRPIASSIMGFEDEVEQSFPRPCRQSDGRFKGTYELTSSIVLRGHDAFWAAVFAWRWRKSTSVRSTSVKLAPPL
jgi:hypothetical protein